MCVVLRNTSMARLLGGRVMLLLQNKERATASARIHYPPIEIPFAGSYRAQGIYQYDVALT